MSAPTSATPSKMSVAGKPAGFHQVALASSATATKAPPMPRGAGTHQLEALGSRAGLGDADRQASADGQSDRSTPKGVGK